MASNLFCDWYNGLQAVNLWELPNRLAEEFSAYRNEFLKTGQRE